MKVSFLVTYYNQEKYVDKSLQSILKMEKPFEYEILIGDDGSQDGTQKKVREYVQRDPQRIRLFIMERNQNRKYDSVERASALRAYLLKEASGDFFCVLDGDDWYCDKKFVKKAVDTYRNHRSLSVVAFGYQKVTGEQKEIVDTGIPEGIVDKKMYIRKYYTHAGACVFRLFHDSAFQRKAEACIFYDDNDIILHSLAYGDMFYWDETVYVYRQRADSIYNRMDEFEKCVLNTLGYDSAIYYLPEYSRDVMIRNLYPVWTVFFLKRYACKLLGKEKYRKYLRQAGTMRDSLAVMLLQSDYSKTGQKGGKYFLKAVLAGMWYPKLVLLAAVRAGKILKKSKRGCKQ